jgi:monovalent cation:H+ antiporter-2, CPA2 family
MAIAEKIRKINKSVYLLARSKGTEHMKELYKVGIDQVIPEKLEMAIDMFDRVLSQFLIPKKEINRLVSHIRNEFFGVFREKDIKNKPSPLHDIAHIEISAIEVEEKSKADGKSITELDLRKNTGVTLLALKREDEIIEHPDADMPLKNGDIAYLLGNPEQVNLAVEIFVPDEEKAIQEKPK